jgi:hypothetical protein
MYMNSTFRWAFRSDHSNVRELPRIVPIKRFRKKHAALVEGGAIAVDADDRAERGRANLEDAPSRIPSGSRRAARAR